MPHPVPPGPAVLFCPADRPERYQKALDAADSVILDLEDAVGPDRKDTARQAIADAVGWLPAERIIVRVNALGSETAEADLRMVREAGLPTVMVPKAHDPAALSELAPLSVIALCETARGVQAAQTLAQVTNCAAMFWGGEDLIADLGGQRSRRADNSYLPVVQHARSTVLLAAAAAGKQCWDSVYLAISDTEGLAEECTDAVLMGFAAKVAIHPSQTQVIRTAYRPTEEQVEWAQALLDEAQRNPGAARFRGQMIDGPLIAQARATLARRA